MNLKRKPLFSIDVDLDDVQKERISIYSIGEVKKKMGQFLTTYSITDPRIKKRIMERIINFLKKIEDKKIYKHPLQESLTSCYTPATKTMNKLNEIAKRKINLKNRIKYPFKDQSPIMSCIFN